MKQPYGIFSEYDGEVKFLYETSVRFPRANQAALKASKSYPSVFFACFRESYEKVTDAKPTIVPVGPRHKPIYHDPRRVDRNWLAPLQLVADQKANRKKMAENLVSESVDFYRMQQKMKTEKMVRAPK